MAEHEMWMQGESQAVEYKEHFDGKADRSRFMRTVVAFANGAGGKIVIGIEDGTGRVVGLPAEANLPQLMDAVVNAVMTSAGLNLMPSKAGAAKKAAQKDADAKTTEKAGKPWQWKVASADVKNSRFNFRDTSVKPNAAITVSDINASGKNLSPALPPP